MRVTTKARVQSPLTVGPVIGAAVLGISAMTVTVIWLGPVLGTLSGVLTVANAVVCVLGLAGSFVAGVRPVMLVFYAFILAWICLPSAYQLGTGRAAWGDPFVMRDPDVTSAAQGVTLLALVSFAVGTLSRGEPERTPPGREGAGIWNAAAFRRYVAVLLVCGYVALPVVVVLSGGFGTFFANRSQHAAALAAAGLGSGGGAADVGLVRLLPMAVAVAALYLVALEARQQRRSGAPLGGPVVLLTIGAVGLWAIFANPLSNSRYVAISPLLAVALLTWPAKRPAAGFGMAAGLLAGLYIVYPLANIFRTTDPKDTLVGLGPHVIAGPDFDGFQQVANSLIYVHRQGYEMGHTIISAVLFFVPRSIWSGKSLPASLPVAADRGYSFTDLSEPFHAELFLNFGWLGVAVGLFLLGRLWAVVDDAYRRADQALLTTFAPYIAFAQIGLIRGPLGSLTPVFVTTGVLIWFGLRAARRKSWPA